MLRPRRRPGFALCIKNSLGRDAILLSSPAIIDVYDQRVGSTLPVQRVIASDGKAHPALSYQAFKT
jgi:hypothetical protein